jgi:hypothetical protein
VGLDFSLFKHFSMASVSFSNPISAKIADLFVAKCKEKNLSTKKDVKSFSVKFASFYMSKGYMECPFPNYLVDYFYQ